VLEESSWERARGQREEEGAGREGRETKAKNLATNWIITASLLQFYLSAFSESQPRNATCLDSRHLWDAKASSDLEVRRAEKDKAASTFCFIPVSSCLNESYF
jgi:hypothetical protein